MNSDGSAISGPATPPVPAEAADGPARMARRAQAVQDALRAFVREHYTHLFGARAPVPAELPLALRLTARPDRNWEVTFDPPLADQLEEAFAALPGHAAACGPGRVFCFRCERNDCEHARPPASLSVFCGYTPVGVPEWRDLVQVALDAGDPRADLLFARHARALAFVQLGHVLRRHQLASFGKAARHYAILGQVVAGYLPLDGTAAALGIGADRTALTVQMVQTRDAQHRTRVRLQVIAAGVTPEQWLELGASSWQPGVFRALRVAAQAVDRLDAELVGLCGAPASARALPLRRVPSLLQQIARRLEQSVRQSTGRTRHAEARRDDRRPVHKALDDASTAGPEELFVDVQRQTWIVCGRQGRTHAFSQDGRHVTSLTLPPDGAALRLRTGRWRRMEEPERVLFLSALRQRRQE